MRSWTVLLAMAFTAGCLGGDEADEATDDPVPTADDAPPVPADDDTNATAPPPPEPAPEPAPAAPSPPPPPPPPPLEVDLAVRVTGLYPVNPGFEAEPSAVPAGALVHLSFTNDDLNPLGKHDWVLEGVEGADTELMEVGQTAELDFTAPAPGEYTYYCSVEGHRGFGMEGALVVT